jgi:hypothetical protein
MKFLDTNELALATAGGQDYIRTKNNVVKGVALRKDLNPDAPNVVVFGKGSNIELRAKLFLEQQTIVPMFIKRDTNQWQYVGDYRATAIRYDSKTIKKYGYTRATGTVAGVLFLEAVTAAQVEVTNGGYADYTTRKEIEAAAILFATAELESRGYVVESREKENIGYDLYAKKRDSELLIEVKGTDGRDPRFFISRNERKCSEAEVNWRLFIVCSARTDPSLHEFSAAEMEASFSFSPLAWECTKDEL